MSRHRNIRNINIDDELDDYDEEADYYGKSFDEEPMSPSTAKFLYQRPKFPSQFSQETNRLAESIPEEAPGSSYIQNNEPQEIFHLDEDNKKATKVNTKNNKNVEIQSKPSSQKVQIPNIQQLKISEQKQTRSGSKSPARAASTNAPTVPKLSAIDIAVASIPNYKHRTRPSGAKESINLVIIGHVDAGKSTLMGHLLFQLGYVEPKVLNKYKQESNRSGKSSFHFAWILDETEEERVRGVTMDIARASFETSNRKINILDAPGHKDFIPNMITGAAIADAALLVVNSTRGEFETGFDQGGQTREHALLVRSLGVSQMVVAVNKLDTMDWSKERYDEVTSTLKNFLQKHAGFTNITFVPLSGLNGDNLKTLEPNHPLRKWYNGPTLVDVLDQLTVPQRAENLPLRIVVNDILKYAPNLIQISAKIETGHIEAGEKIYVMPKADSAVIKSINWDDSLSTSTDVYFAGDQVIICLSGSFELESVSPGCVICRGGSECLVPIRKFVAKIVVFDIVVPILKGTKAELFSHSICTPCTITQLKSILNKSTGQVINEKPRCIVKNQSAEVVIETDILVNLEPYNKCKSSTGRINLRCNGKTIAAGVVTESINC